MCKTFSFNDTVSFGCFALAFVCLFLSGCGDGAVAVFACDCMCMSVSVCFLVCLVLGGFLFF